MIATEKEPREYPYSGGTLRRAWRGLLGLAAILLAAIAVGCAAVTIARHADPVVAVAIGALLTIALGIPLIIGFGIQYEGLRETTLAITASSIERRRGLRTQEVTLAGWKRIEFWTRADGTTRFIKLVGGPFREAVVAGFEDMDSIAADIEAAVRGKVPVERRSYRFDPENRAVVAARVASLLLLVAVLGVLMVTFGSLGQGVFSFAMGIFWLVSIPSSRRWGRPWVDVALGCVWLALGAMYLIHFLQGN